MSLQRILFALLCALGATVGNAATTATVTTQPTFDLYQGSSLVSPRVTRPTFAECVEAGRLLNRGDGCQSRNGRFRRVTVADPPVVVAPPAVTWTKCADEDGICILTVDGVVRYGAGANWAEKLFPAGPVACNNATFGDPAFMVAKTCEKGGVPLSPPAPAVGTAALTWTAPTKYADGTAITGAVTYKVYHGTSPTTLTDVIPVAGTSYIFNQLASGTHYFAVASVVAGVEGDRSAVASKVLP